MTIISKLLLPILASVLLTACGGGSGGGGGETPPTVTAPQFSVDGVNTGLQPVSLEVAEGNTLVANVRVSKGSISIAPDSVDASAFEFSGGTVSFKTAPDFENPGDADANNIYTVRLEASADGVTAGVTLNVSIADAFEPTGRVIDGPVAGAQIFVDNNCNEELNDDEASGTTDSKGYWQLPVNANFEPTQEGCIVKIVAIGGTDTQTGKSLPNQVLASDLPKDRSKPVVVTPLTTVIASIESEEEKGQVLEALGLQGTSVDDLLTTDVWAAAEEELDETATEEQKEAQEKAKALQRVNAQVATIMQAAEATSGTDEETDDEATTSTVAKAATKAAVQSIANQIVQASKDAAETGTKASVSLADPVVVKAAVQESVKAASVKQAEVAAANAGRAFDETDKAEAEKKAEIKVAAIEEVLDDAVAAVETINAVLADKDINPTEEVATAAIKVAQQQVQTQIKSTVTAVTRVVDAALSGANLEDATDELVATAKQAVATDETAQNEINTLAQSTDDETLLKELEEQIQQEEQGSGTEVDRGFDTDGDGIFDNLDKDDDNDGVNDGQDAFPLDRTESVDTDGDGIGNNADSDDDGDDVPDKEDDLPLNAKESVDTDRDGIGNNADTDDDNDGLIDTKEISLGTDPLVRDTDGDDITDGDEVNVWMTNALDDDQDQDGLSDLFELVVGTNPAKKDTDADGRSDSDEIGASAISSYIVIIRKGYGDIADSSSIASEADIKALRAAFEPIYLNSDPRKADTDGGGVNDGDEINNGTNPKDPTDDTKKDADKDGIADNVDNCPNTANADQANLDKDGAGDLCDADIDGDGVANGEDLSPNDPAIGQSGFSIWRFALADHIDGRELATLYGLDPLVETLDGEEVLTTELENSSIDQSNLLSLIAGESNNEPRIVFLMDSVPEASTSGNLQLSFSIMDVSEADTAALEELWGDPEAELTAAEEEAKSAEALALLDGQSPGERKISAMVQASWTSDGEDITISVPAGQTQTVSYKVNNVTLTGTFTDQQEDSYILSAMTGYANYPASLEIRIANFLRRFEDQIPGEISNLFQRAGMYYVSASITFVDVNGVLVDGMTSYRGMPFSEMKSLVTIEDITAPVVPANAFDIAVMSPYQMDTGEMSEQPGEGPMTGAGEDHMDYSNCYTMGSEEALGFLGMSIIAPNEPQCAEEGQVEVIELYPLLYGDALEFDFGPGVSLDGPALNAAVSGRTSDELLPVIQFALAQVADGNGIFRLRVGLVDGEDGHRDEGERELSIEVDVAWSGNGETAQMATSGDLFASFIGSGSTICPVSVDGEPTCSTMISNNQADILRFDAAGPNYGPSFSMRLVDLFDANVVGASWGEGVSVSFDDYFSGSDQYTVVIDLFEIEGPSFFYGGMPIRQVEGILTVDNAGAVAP